MRLLAAYNQLLLQGNPAVVRALDWVRGSEQVHIYSLWFPIFCMCVMSHLAGLHVGDAHCDPDAQVFPGQAPGCGAGQQQQQQQRRRRRRRRQRQRQRQLQVKLQLPQTAATESRN